MDSTMRVQCNAMHWINSPRCEPTPVANSCSSVSLDEHKPIRRLPIQVLTVPMLLNFCTQKEGTCVSTSLGRAVGFGIWSALYDQATQCGHSCDMSSPTPQSHPIPNHPQIPTSCSSLDYRTHRAATDLIKSLLNRVRIILLNLDVIPPRGPGTG
jgi:hypothetical protein